MNFVVIFSLVCAATLQALSTPPPVAFLEEPQDLVVPWQGPAELRCAVNHSQASTTWLAVRNSPVHFKYSKGILVPVRNPSEARQTEVGVLSNEWSRPQSGGQLRFHHPGGGTELSSPLIQSGSVQIPWIEGSYVCKATIPGYGSLLSKTAQVRLSDSFLEPGLPTAGEDRLSSWGRPGDESAPDLGGGFYWPNEVAVLRCPLITIGQKQPQIKFIICLPNHIPSVQQKSRYREKCGWSRIFFAECINSTHRPTPFPAQQYSYGRFNDQAHTTVNFCLLFDS